MISCPKGKRYKLNRRYCVLTIILPISRNPIIKGNMFTNYKYIMRALIYDTGIGCSSLSYKGENLNEMP